MRFRWVEGFACSMLLMAVTVGPSWADAQTASQPQPQAGRTATADSPAQSTELAKQTQNPVSSLISVPLQANWDFGLGDRDATGTLFNIQPVMPFGISRSTNVILRVIMPLASQPGADGVGAVEIVLNSLGMGIGKTSVFRAVQAVARQVPGLKREKLLSGYKAKAVGADVTSVRCNGQWVTVGIVVDAVNGMVLSIDELAGEDAEQLQDWLEPILDAVDADVVVSDDADAFKKVSDETGRSQQVCKSHVVRNRSALVEELSALIGAGQDRSLEAIHITPEQALADLASLKEMIHCLSRAPSTKSPRSSPMRSRIRYRSAK